MNSTYEELQTELASRGFTYTPITEDQFNIVMNRDGFDVAIDVAMDVSCGFKFGVAHLLNTHGKGMEQ